MTAGPREQSVSWGVLVPTQAALPLGRAEGHTPTYAPMAVALGLWGSWLTSADPGKRNTRARQTAGLVDIP